VHAAASACPFCHGPVLGAVLMLSAATTMAACRRDEPAPERVPAASASAAEALEAKLRKAHEEAERAVIVYAGPPRSAPDGGPLDAGPR
jgi:hypothetical protein